MSESAAEKALRAISGEMAASGATNLPSIPAVPLTDDPSVNTFLASVKTWLEKASSSGLTGFATRSDLVSAGVLVPGSDGDVHVANPISLLVPPAPKNLTVTGAASVIILQWDNPFESYNNHAYAEIWAAEEDNFSMAAMVGQSSGIMFGHSVGNEAQRYYWVRFVSTSGIKGPFSSVNGTPGSTAIDPEEVFNSLIGTEYYQPFFTLDEPTEINGITLPAGTYIKDAFIATLNASRIVAGNIAADRIVANVMAAVNASVENLSAAKMTANVIFAINAAIEYINANRIDTRGLQVKDTAGNVIVGMGTGLPADYLSTGYGSNLCRNSDFSAGLIGWTLSYNPFSATSGINLSPSWSVNGGVGVGCNTLYVYQPNGTSAGYCEYISDPIAVEGGQRYMVSAYTGAHRCSVDVFAYTLDASGSYVGVFGNDLDYNDSAASGGPNLSDYKRHAQAAVVASNVTAIRLVLRKSGTKAGTDSYMFVARAMVEKVGALTTNPGPWSASGATGALAEKSKVNWWDDIINIPSFGNFAYLSSITAANISSYFAAAAIGEAYIAELAVTNGKIRDLAVSTLKIQDNAVTIPISAVGGGSATTPAINVGAGKVCIVAYAQATRYSQQGTMNLFKNGALWQSYPVQCAASNGETGAYFGSRSVILIDTPGGSAYYMVSIDGNSEFATGILALGTMK